MSRWIDADAFVADARMVELQTANEVLFALDHQPSIDIVRCGECKYLKVHNTKELYAVCTKWHIRFYPFEEDTRTHGCSWGERRE